MRRGKAKRLQPGYDADYKNYTVVVTYMNGSQETHYVSATSRDNAIDSVRACVQNYRTISVDGAIATFIGALLGRR